MEGWWRVVRFVWLVFARTTGKTRVGKLPCFPYLVLTYIIKGGGSIHIMSWLFIFLRCLVFPMVSALHYSLLKHVVINNDL